MRWPLRNQVLLPMTALMLTALLGVSTLNAYLSVRNMRERIERDLAEVTDTLAASNFPLTNGVLRQMRGLSGADFVLTDREGHLMASSTSNEALLGLTAYGKESGSSLALAKPVSAGQRRFFHTASDLRRSAGPERPAVLHIIYPEESYLQATRDVVYPPLVVGGIAVILVIGFSLGIASRVTGPLRRLQMQVDKIAEGDFQLVPVPSRNDEIADLSRSVNRMADMLAHYESEIRHNEQLRTLGQLGGGIAHQIRNSVTGCRMAVELHDRECPLKGEEESLDVAKRQLELMEKYLRRFLSLGRSDSRPHVRVDLCPIVDNVVSLVRPTARHLGVGLEWRPPDGAVVVRGDADALEQLLVNLVLNGIEAASRSAGGDISAYYPQAENTALQQQRSRNVTQRVDVLLRPLNDRVEFEVWDTGGGPAASVRASLFEPFVTGRPDGTGLGLAVAREVAAAHEGEVRWHRDDGQTCFLLELPMLYPEP